MSYKTALWNQYFTIADVYRKDIHRRQGPWRWFQGSKTKNGHLGPARVQTSILGHPAALGGNFSHGCIP